MRVVRRERRSPLKQVSISIVHIHVDMSKTMSHAYRSGSESSVNRFEASLSGGLVLILTEDSPEFPS